MRIDVYIGLNMASLISTFALLTKRVQYFAPRYSFSTTQSLSASVDPFLHSEYVTDDVAVKDALHRIRQANQVPDEVTSKLLNFTVDGVRVGKVTTTMAERLCQARANSPEVFKLQNDRLTLSDTVGSTPEARTVAVARVMETLRDDGVIMGWRDELYPVSDGFYNPPVFLVERAAASMLGVLEYGVHINGIVQETLQDEPKMWIARRSADKSKFPGMLDHVVAGGQPAGIGLMENVVKECEEEAGIPKQLVLDGIKAAGAISNEYWDARRDKVNRAVLFCYDLHLPKDFTPIPMDGEVDEFALWTMDQVKRSMDPAYDDPIKPNCYLVVIDYLLRVGHLSPDVPGYLDVVRELRSGDCR